MKKVLIAPSNTDLNRGDQSLTWASIDLVKDIFGHDSDIYLYKTQSRLAKVSQMNHQTEQLGYPLLTRIITHPRRNDDRNGIGYTKLTYLKWGWRAITDLLVTAMLLSKIPFLNKIASLCLSQEKRDTLLKFKTMDVLVVKGGGFLHSYGSLADPYVMYFQLFDVFLAERHNIPIFFLPNSVGPLKNMLAKKIVIKALRYGKVVFARESRTHNFLLENKIEAILSPDLGFYLKPSKRDFTHYLKTKGIPINRKKCVGITLRPYRFDEAPNATLLYKNYIGEFEKLTSTLIKNDIFVVFVAHTIGPSTHEDDRIPLLEIYTMYRNSENVAYLDDKKLNSQDLEKIYSYFDLMIGTRFHSVIFSLNVLTPAIAIAYGGNKASGIMKDMQLSEYVLPIEDPDSSKLYELVMQSFNEVKFYKAKINKYKVRLEDERNNLIDIVRASL